MPTHTPTKTTRRDLYAEVTDKLIAAIEADPADPKMPWRRSNAPLWRPLNAVTQKPYRGINVLMLWGAAETQCTAESQPLDTNLWATYNQWLEIGAQVKKGEKASQIIKYGEYEVVPDGSDADDDGKRLYLKSYSVFNARQVEGFIIPDAPEALPPLQRIALAEAFVANTKALIVEGGERAFYQPSNDTIHMPDDTLFTGTADDGSDRAQSYAAVKLHETIHWTSIETRCDRQLGKRFGDGAYAAEELVAEIGAAFLCADLGITQDVRADHAQYLAHWLRLLKGDSKAIFTVAAAAERAVEFLKGLQPAAPAPDRPTTPDAPPDPSPTPEGPA